MKKIKKYILRILVFLLTLNIIDILVDNVNSISDISKHKKVFIYDDERNIIYEKANNKESSYVKLEDINDITRKVFIEIEDRRFYYHCGIDPISVVNAFFHNIKNDYTIGGSTITQQYVKNLYLSNEKTYIRKIKECYYALRVESLYSKDEILEGYLNTIYFNNGIYGINDASYYYFNKSPNKLTLKEAVSLVSIIKSPTYYCLLNNYNNNQERTNKLLNALYSNGVITKKDLNEAIYEELTIFGNKVKKYENSVMYFKDYVFKNINFSNKETHIYTMYNSELNTYIDNLIKDTSCDISIIVMDKYGYIVSCIGNKNYYDSSYNIGTMASRMIGSTIKPMLYYEALNFGMNTSSTFISEKKDFIIDNQIISISNFNDKYDNKPINMEYALGTSDNIYAMKTHLFIGTNKLQSFLKRFDITPISDIYTLCLGTQDMSLLNLTSIYNTFLNLGLYTSPKGYTHYTQNNLTVNNLNLKKDLLDYNICCDINKLLSSTFNTKLNATNNVTGTSISHLLNKNVAGKTGLTDYDSYIIGYTNDYVVSVWSGHSDNTLLTDSKNKKLPKELFYKIVNFLPESKNNKII